MTAVLGIDIGGSTTRAVRAEDGAHVAEARAGSANVRSVGAVDAGHQLDIALAGLRIDDVVAVCAGAAGADSADARAELHALIAARVPGAAVEVVHDARLILAAAGLDDGIAVIAGTGSAGWGRAPDGREARAGGFGYLLGDEGSGWWTAREAVRHVLHLADTGAPADPLTDALLAACGVATPVALFDLFYARPERAFWAGFGGVVARLVDPASTAILGRAADALAALATTVGTRLGIAGPVVLGGGFAVHEPALRAAVTQRLAAAGLPDVRLIPRDPVAGAVRLACALLENPSSGPATITTHLPAVLGALGIDRATHDHDPPPSRPTVLGALGMTSTLTRGGLMAAEIAEQPAQWRRLLTDAAPELDAVAARIRAANPHTVLLVARGTSDHAALYAKYLVEIRLGKAAGLVSPSTMTAYGARPDLRGVLMIAVSQSGGSPDLVKSVEVARSCGALTVAVTNNATSPLATAADAHVDVLAGPERAVAATKSYTAQLLALHQLLDRVAGGSGAAAAPLPDLADAVLAGGDRIAELATRYRFAQRLVTTGRGYSYPTAREAALKLMETAYLSAQAFSAADLMHGPLAMIDPQVPVLAVVADGTGGRAMAPVLPRLAERGADVCIVGAASAGATVVLPDGAPEQLSPLLEILPFQLLALHVAVDRGGDPDAPRGLAKVTETL